MLCFHFFCFCILDCALIPFAKQIVYSEEMILACWVKWEDFRRLAGLFSFLLISLQSPCTLSSCCELSSDTLAYRNSANQSTLSNLGILYSLFQVISFNYRLLIIIFFNPFPFLVFLHILF